MLLLLASLSLAQAQFDCGPQGSDAGIAGLVALLDVEPPRAPPPEVTDALPTGTLSAEDLERAFQQVTAADSGLRGLFALLADGESRVLSGDIVRALFEKYGVKLDLLPMGDLQQIVSDGSSVEFQFNFSGQKEVTIPAGSAWVYQRNRARRVETDAQRLRFRSRVRFTIGAGGLTGLRAGDIQAHGGWLAGFVNINLFMKRAEGQVAETDGDPNLAVGEDGRPLTVDGKYVYQRYDDWTVITGPLGYRSEMGIPSW
jgi:hypothetical protein